jgi:hypothetical protein
VNISLIPPRVASKSADLACPASAARASVVHPDPKLFAS